MSARVCTRGTGPLVHFSSPQADFVPADVAFGFGQKAIVAAAAAVKGFMAGPDSVQGPDAEEPGLFD